MSRQKKKKTTIEESSKSEIKHLHLIIPFKTWRIIRNAIHEEPRANGFICKLIEAWADDYQKKSEKKMKKDVDFNN